MSCSGKLIEDNVRQRSFAVDQNFEGWRLDEFLENRIDGMSLQLATRVADEGDVRIDGDDDVNAATALRDGQLVVVREHLDPEYVLDDRVATLYADDAVIVLNKPAGMLVHETASVRLNTITHFLQRQGLDGAEPVHRLDGETSGVLVCARKQQFVAPLRDQFAARTPRKGYRALVADDAGRWQPGDRATLDTPLGADSDSRLPHKMGPGDLPATTHVQVLARVDHPMGPLADLHIRIETGRQHQIRVHLAMENTPVAGDKMYGQSDQFFIDLCDNPDNEALTAQLHFDRHALHARRIELIHPTEEIPLEVEAPLPDPWTRSD